MRVIVTTVTSYQLFLIARTPIISNDKLVWLDVYTTVLLNDAIAPQNLWEYL